MIEKAGFNAGDAFNEFDRQKQLSQQQNRKWDSFLNSAPAKIARGYVDGMKQAFTGSGSIVDVASRVWNNPYGGSFLRDQLHTSEINNLIKNVAAPVIEHDRASVKQLQLDALDQLKTTNPNSQVTKDLEAKLNTPEAAPIENLSDVATTLEEKIYKPYHENLAQALLTINPDIVAKAREDKVSPWTKAAEYSPDISPGQAAFDLGADVTNSDLFNIDITDPEQRDYMFYQGDGLAGAVGKTVSGGADLGVQLLDPLWGAGKLAKATRLATLDVRTVDEASKLNPWRQSYFVEGKDALKTYAEQQKNYTVVKDEIAKLNQEKIALKAINPADYPGVSIPDQIAIIDEEIAQKTASLGTIPTVAKGWDEFHNQLIEGKMTADQIMQHSRLKRFAASNPRLAHAYELAAKSGDKRDLIDLDLIATGIDPSAADRLRVRRESLVTILEDQRNQLNNLREEIKIYAGDTENADQVIKKLSDDAYKVYKAYLQEDKFLSAAVRSEEERVINTVGSMKAYAPRYRSVEKWRAGQAKDRARLAFEPFQVSRLGRPVYLARYVGEKTNRYRPNNMVTIEGVDMADGVDEFTAWLQNANGSSITGKYLTVNKVLGPEASKSLLRDFIAADSRAQKTDVLRRSERMYLRALIEKAGVQLPEQGTTDLLDNFIDEWLTFKDQKVDELRNKAFYIDADGRAIAMPLLKTELAYSYYMADSEALAKFVVDNTPDLKNILTNRLFGPETVIGQAKTVGKDTVQLLDSMWRFGVLARLGYPVRNVGAEYLKFTTVGGMFRVFGPQYSTFNELPAATKRAVQDWYSNKHAFYQRMSVRNDIRQETKMAIGDPAEYFKYVENNNILRRGEIMSLTEMNYEDFRTISQSLRDPARYDSLPEEVQKALAYEDQIVDSENKAAILSERWAMAQKSPRSTKTMTVNGYEFEQAFMGTQGAALRDSLSSGPTMELMSAGMRQLAKGKTGQFLGVHAVINPSDAEYFANLSNIIATDMVSSNAAKRIMQASLVDEKLYDVEKAAVLAEFKKSMALRDEIRASGRYDYYEEQIAAEQKALADKINESGLNGVPLETMSANDLLKLGIGDLDGRSIEERYFDEIYSMIVRYFPKAELRKQILDLKVGETITPQRLRASLSEFGDNLSPITGDVLTAEERQRALAFRKIEGKVDIGELGANKPTMSIYDAARKYDPINVFDRKLRSFVTGKKAPATKPEKEWRTLTPQEQIRSLEAQTRLRALSEDASFGLLFRKFRRRIMTSIGQIPEDNFVKWPFGRMVYNRHITEVSDNWRRAGFEPTGADLYALHSSARMQAISESRRYLYSSMRKLRGPGNVPFVAPFYQAATIGAKNWLRVGWNDPSIIARRVWMYDYINQHADYDAKTGNRYLTVMIPQQIIDALPQDSGYAKALQAFPEMRFSTNSFNLMLPGMRMGNAGEFDPTTMIVSSIGVGPGVTIAIEELVKSNPAIDQAVYEKTGLIVPVRSILDKFAPSQNITADPAYYDSLPPYLKRGYAVVKGADSAEYARINLQLFMTYVHRMETGEIERVPLSTIEKRVNEETVALITLRGLSNASLPAIPQFRGEVNTMIDLYRDYQTQWKEKAFSHFTEDHPDWWIVAATLSDNPGGLLSTESTVHAIQKHSALINDVRDAGGGIGERLLGMVANTEGDPADFDPASRVWLINNEYYTRLGDPKKAVEATMIERGNNEYFAMRDVRDQMVKEIGVKIHRPDITVNSTSVPEIARIKNNFDSWVESYAKENPTWYTMEYEPRQRQAIQPTAIRVARQLIDNNSWYADQKPGNWVDQLEEFLAEQDAYANAIESNPASKKQRTEQFKMVVNRLKSENDTFAYYYDRFFDGAQGEPFLTVVKDLG